MLEGVLERVPCGEAKVLVLSSLGGTLDGSKNDLEVLAGDARVLVVSLVAGEAHVLLAGETRVSVVSLVAGDARVSVVSLVAGEAHVLSRRRGTLEGSIIEVFLAAGDSRMLLLVRSNLGGM